MVITIVLLTVVVFVLVDILLRIVTQRAQRAETKAEEAPEIDLQQLPSGLFVHSGHTWVKILRSGRVQIGLDDFVRQALGCPDRLLLLRPGEQVRRGSPLLTLEQAGRQLVLTAPLSGTVEDRNAQLATHPAALESGDDRENWVYALRPDRLGEEIDELKVAEKASAWLKAELQRLVDWTGSLRSPIPGIAMQDGGMPVCGFLGRLDEEAWRDFQQLFLDPQNAN